MRRYIGCFGNGCAHRLHVLAEKGKPAPRPRLEVAFLGHGQKAAHCGCGTPVFGSRKLAYVNPVPLASRGIVSIAQYKLFPLFPSHY